MTPPSNDADDVFDGARVHDALVRRLHRRAVVTGQLTLPAVPSLLDSYVAMFDAIFAAVGRRFTAEQLEHFRFVVSEQLTVAYTASPRSQLVVSYDAPVGTVLNYHVKPEWWSVEAAYDDWVSTRESPLFGTEPDARVVALADAADPASFPVLDIGAGTGRNALALARRGYPVDAVELTERFAELLRTDAQREALDVRVLSRDVFADVDDLRGDYRLIVLSEVVSDFRSVEQLRRIFELAAGHLAPGGRLVFNAFVAKDGYHPDGAARELGQQTYTSIFTRDEIDTAAMGLPIELTSDDSVLDYERAGLPDGTWPPTGWYEAWVSGNDVYDLDRAESPVDMRWLVYVKPESSP